MLAAGTSVKGSAGYVAWSALGPLQAARGIRAAAHGTMNRGDLADRPVVPDSGSGD